MNKVAFTRDNFNAMFVALKEIANHKPANIYVKIWDDTMENDDCLYCEEMIDIAKETLEKISEEDVKCDMTPEFNCTTCKYKKECMPKENLER